MINDLNDVMKIFPRRKQNNWGKTTMISMLGIGLGTAIGYGMARGNKMDNNNPVVQNMISDAADDVLK